MSPGLGSVCASLVLLLSLLSQAARAASISLTRDLAGPQSFPVALRHGTEDSEFYEHEGRLCRKCPAGSHVKDHCVTTNTISSCVTCKEGAEFTEYPNALSKCLPCRVCRKDEVQLDQCKSSKNTHCACKNGTFCSPDHPCEICQRCKARCPEGEVQVSACTPQSDMQCARPTGPPPAVDGITAWQASGIAFAVVVVLVLLVVLLCFHCWHSSSSGVDPRRKSPSFKDHLLSYLRRCTQGRLGTQDNRWNEQVDQESHRELLAVPDPKEPERKDRCETGVLPTQATPLEHERNQVSQLVGRRRNLVPKKGKDPIETLRCSFDIFSQEVPCKDWRRFGRALLLTDNEIEIAERSDKYSQEQHYQMLFTWLTKAGAGASVNQLLETLDKIGLRGVADNICSRLCDLYEEEVLN